MESKPVAILAVTALVGAALLVSPTSASASSPSPKAPHFYKPRNAGDFGVIRNAGRPHPFAWTAYECGAGGWDLTNGLEVCATARFRLKIKNRGPGRVRLVSAFESSGTNVCRVRLVGRQPLVAAGKYGTVTLQVTGTGFCGGSYVQVNGRY